MTNWNPDNYIDPYVNHGDKSVKSKKITVSIPTELHDILIKEKNRRIDNNMYHATISELICEAFLHSYTGQPLPTDEELVSKVKLRRKKS